VANENEFQLVSDGVFAAMVERSAAAPVASQIKNLVAQATAVSLTEARPGHAIGHRFTDLVVKWLDANASELNPISRLAAVELSGRILFQYTEPRRQLIAGTAFNRILANQVLPLASGRAASNGNRTVCYLTSMIYSDGGHSRVLEDLIRLVPDHRHHVIVTNSEHYDPSAFNYFLRPATNCEITVLTGSYQISKLFAGLQALEEINPLAIIDLGHPYDPVVQMMLERFPAKKRLHVHHADHSFSLIPVSGEISVAAFFPGAAEALQMSGVSRLIHLPLTCTDPASVSSGIEAAVPSYDASVFTTATSGGANKFDRRLGQSYVELLKHRYLARSGRHVHFGPLRPETVFEIESLVSALGRREDFVQIPFVPYLSVALAALRPNIYIGSFPMGGKRASIEAMAAGCPIAAWQSEGYHSAADIIYPDRLRWNDLTELANIVGRSTKQNEDWQSRRSRAFFEEFHSESRLKESFQVFLRDVSSETAKPL
jgi:hypothetical protein